MKKYLYLLLLATLALAPACGSKGSDPAPDYTALTPIGSRFSISKSGSAGYTLTNLQLKITKATSSNQDTYLFQGTYNTLESAKVYFYVDPKRTGNGPWPATGVVFFYATPDFKGNTTLVDNTTTASLATDGNGGYTGSFTAGSSSGKLTQ